MICLCLSCGHQQQNDAGGAFCPQCGDTWEPIASAAAQTTQVSESTAGSSTGGSATAASLTSGDIPSPSQTVEQHLSAPVERMSLNHRPAPGIISPVCSQSVSVLTGQSGVTGQSASPFSVFVNKRQQPREFAAVCLEVQIRNESSRALNGHVWLVDEHGNRGTPKRFSLAASVVGLTDSNPAVTVFPQLAMHHQHAGHVAIRIQELNTGEAFWQAEQLLQLESNGAVSVQIDKSVHTTTHLAGIDRGIVNVYAGQSADLGTWQPVSLRYRGPLELAEPADTERPVSNVRKRRCRIVSETDAPPVICSSRLTLAQTLASGEDAFVELIAGEMLSLGRARTWDSREHQGSQPNDVVLRTRAADEDDRYISRYHAIIRRTADNITFRNLSAAGSVVAGRDLAKPGESLVLPDYGMIKPGQNFSHNKAESLGLHVRRTPTVIRRELYDCLVTDFQLRSGMQATLCSDVVSLTRSDEIRDKELYIFMHHATFIGRAGSSCGWKIDDPSVHDIHAILTWFDDSFWLQPYAADCSVKVNNQTVPPAFVRRLLPNSVVDLGKLRFVVLPEWRQHITDCGCCRGHN